MKVLIIKLSAFGDMIHALPALDDLLQRPEVDAVHWLMDARFAFVADLFPEGVIPHVVALKGRGGLRSGVAMAAALRQQQFDVVLDLQGLIKSGLMARAIGAPSYGFDASQSPEWPNRWLVQPVPFHDDDRHVVQCYRRIAAAPFLQRERDTSPSMAMAYAAPKVVMRAAMEKQADAIRQQWGLVGAFALCHIGGSYATKRLPEAHWRALLTQMGARQTTVVLWGSDDEYGYARRVTADIDGVFAAKARLPIAALAGLLRGCCGYIGPDSGVTHLAAAVGTPTVTLWGPTSPNRMGAQGNQHYDIIAENRCAPCFQRRCDQFICMPSLSTEKIYEVFLQAVAADEKG